MDCASPLHDRGFAHPGLAHQHRVVLGAPGKDLHHPLSFAAAADHRIQLIVVGELGQVATELVQNPRT